MGHDHGITLEFDAAASTLALTGELDCATAGQVAEFTDAVLPRPHQELTVSLAELQFIDSSGVAALSGLADRFGAHGVQVVLTGASAQVARIIRLAGHGVLVPSVPDGGRAPRGARALGPPQRHAPPEPRRRVACSRRHGVRGVHGR